MNDAIQDSPTIGQRALSNHDLECDGTAKANTVACQKALHRVCAQSGTRHALSLANNLWRVIKQLACQRPQVSLAGVITETVGNIAMSSYAPMPQESFAVTLEELQRLHSRCLRDDRAYQTPGLSASILFCQSMGWDTGMIFEVSTRAWVSCFKADEILEIADSAAIGCGVGQRNSNQCRFQVSTYCQSKAYDAGVIQEALEEESDALVVHCFYATSTDQYIFQTGTDTMM